MSARGLTIAGYLLLSLVALGVEMSARRGGSVPAFGTLLRRAMGQRSAQLAILLVWWWVGWHFLLAL